jgi:hypothetical protein
MAVARFAAAWERESDGGQRKKTKGMGQPRHGSLYL